MLPIRFALGIGPLRVGDGLATHALVSHKYLTALKATGLAVRALPFNGMPYGLLHTNPDWSPLKDLFFNEATLLDKTGTSGFEGRFINMVCGFGSIFSGMLTTNAVNVAIIVSWPRVPNEWETNVLSEYDAVVCPNMSDVAAITAATRLKPTLLPINPLHLKTFVERYDA